MTTNEKWDKIINFSDNHVKPIIKRGDLSKCARELEKFEKVYKRFKVKYNIPSSLPTVVIPIIRRKYTKDNIDILNYCKFRLFIENKKPIINVHNTLSDKSIDISIKDSKIFEQDITTVHGSNSVASYFINYIKEQHEKNNI
jgi:hypothetical protein